jgi:predicted transcriptional regulator of viral defense system
VRFVRFSGDGLTQGAVNTRIESVPVRIYRAAKTIADCLKYRQKIGGSLAAEYYDKVSLKENAANKGFGTLRRYAGSENSFTPLIPPLVTLDLDRHRTDGLFFKNRLSALRGLREVGSPDRARLIYFG